MEKKSKIILFSFFALIIFMVGWLIYKFLILNDYYIMTEISCDPGVENCYIYVCDPVEDTDCSEAIADRISYYKLIQKKAYNMPVCENEDESCPEILCLENEDCKIILCNSVTAEEGACSEKE